MSSTLSHNGGDRVRTPTELEKISTKYLKIRKYCNGIVSNNYLRDCKNMKGHERIWGKNLENCDNNTNTFSFIFKNYLQNMNLQFQVILYLQA